MENLEFEINGSENVISDVSAVVVASGRMPKFVFTRIVDPYEDDQTVHWRSMRPYGPQGQGPTDLFDDLEPVSGPPCRGGGHRFRTTGRVYGSQGLDGHGRPRARKNPRRRKMRSGSPWPWKTCLTSPCVRKCPRRPPEQLLNPAVEIELGFDEQALKAEASRCLNCGLLCYKRDGKLPAQA